MVRKRMRTRGADGEESSRRLRLEDGQRLLESGDLVLPALLPLLVGHRLRGAPGLHLRQAFYILI